MYFSTALSQAHTLLVLFKGSCHQMTFENIGEMLQCVKYQLVFENIGKLVGISEHGVSWLCYNIMR